MYEGAGSYCLLRLTCFRLYFSTLPFYLNFHFPMSFLTHSRPSLLSLRPSTTRTPSPAYPCHSLFRQSFGLISLVLYPVLSPTLSLYHRSSFISSHSLPHTPPSPATHTHTHVRVGTSVTVAAQRVGRLHLHCRRNADEWASRISRSAWTQIHVRT